MRFPLAVLFLAFAWAQAQELPSVTRMPDFPKAYQMRDWKTTARNFDQLVFDQTRKGEFLPLLWMDRAKRVNPTDGFALPTYVGDLRQTLSLIHI